MVAPSSAPRSMASKVLTTAMRRTAGSLAVKAPSLNRGWENRLTVAMGTLSPVTSSGVSEALEDGFTIGGQVPQGTRSLS